jgi:hypothetical protein
MILLTPLLALCPLPQQTWNALPLPRICEERHFGALPAPLELGRHIDLGDRNVEGLGNSQILFAPQDLGALLSQTAAVAQKSLQVSPYAPPLYIQADVENLAWAQGTLDAISLATARQFLQVNVWLVPGSSEASTPPAAGQKTPGQFAWQTEMLSGEEQLLGRREQESFLCNFDVDVSTQAGVAAPTIGQVTTGKTLRLSVARVNGGERYHLRAQLDLAELRGFTSFDPGTPDLGTFMQPTVDSLGLNFSAVGEMGELQKIVIQGAPLDQSDWVLWIRVQGKAEPQGARAADLPMGHDWRALDVSFLEARPRNFPSLSPGAGLESSVALEPIESGAAPISASGVLSLLQSSGRSRRSSSGSNGQDPLQVCRGLLLVAASADPAGLAELAATFVRAAEAQRLHGSRIHLRHGDLRVEFPSAMGEVARLWVGSERVLVTGYRSEIAPSTWMPRPLVEHLRDGLAWQGRLNSQRLNSEAWQAQTESINSINQKQAQLGALQLPKRRVRTGHMALPTDGSKQVLMAATGTQAELSLSVHAVTTLGK